MIYFLFRKAKGGGRSLQFYIEQILNEEILHQNYLPIVCCTKGYVKNIPIHRVVYFDKDSLTQHRFPSL